MQRNRRYNYLMTTLIQSEYFYEEAIKMRHPLLHYMYIGRYLNDGLGSQQSSIMQ